MPEVKYGMTYETGWFFMGSSSYIVWHPSEARRLLGQVNFLFLRDIRTLLYSNVK